MRKRDRYLILLFVAGLAAAHVRGGVKAAGNEAWTSEQQAIGYVVFEHSPMTNLPPSLVPAAEAVVKQLSCTLARDEYESLQLGVHALARDLQAIQIDVELDLAVSTYHRISPEFKAELATAPVDTGEISDWVLPRFICSEVTFLPSWPAARASTSGSPCMPTLTPGRACTGAKSALCPRAGRSPSWICW